MEGERSVDDVTLRRATDDDLPHFARMVEAILTEGALQALDAVYLFTEGSEPFFARFGFRVIHRDEVPSSVRRWAEVHGGLAPTATAMRVKLIEG